MITLLNYYINHRLRLPDCITRNVDSNQMKFIMNECYIKYITFLLEVKFRVEFNIFFILFRLIDYNYKYYSVSLRIICVDSFVNENTICSFIFTYVCK